MPDSTETDRDEAFCGELVRRGWASEAQVEEVRRLRAAAEELGDSVDLEELLVKKGFVTPARASTARREVAARLGQSIRIGKYEILGRVGEGGSGIVYRAYQTTLGREVALKVLSRQREGEEEYLERFLREARVAVTLNHVNIVRGLDYGYADGYHFFAMELVEGESFFQMIRREGRLREAKAIDIVLQMVRALEHAQKFRIVHRDIKPENILVTRSGTAKLCDLGLARPLIEGGQSDSEGRPMGTALYVAPEQIRQEKSLDFRADIYSLGATLYHALTGAAPFTSPTAKEILRKHLSAPVPNPRDQVLEISSGTASVVMKMLAKDPADRYQSLEALDEDLDSVREGRPPVNTITIGRRAAPLSAEAVADIAGARRVPSGRPSGSRRIGIVVGVASAAVLGAAGWFFLGRDKPEPPPEPPPAVTGPDTGRKATGVDKDAMREARENAAAAALAEAEAFGKEHGEDRPESIERMRRVSIGHPDTAAGRVARARAEELEKARRERVDREVARRKETAAQALAEKRYGDAHAAWSEVPEEWEGTAAAEEAAAARAAVEAAAARDLEGAKALVAKALGEDPAARDAARKALGRLRECGLPEVAAAAGKALESLETTLREREERLARAWEAWTAVCPEALLAAGRGAAAGEAVLDARAADLEPLGTRVDRLRSLLKEMSGFLDAARAGFARAVAGGEPIRLRVPGRPGGAVAGRATGVRPEGFEIQRGPAVEVVPPAEVEPEDLAALAWRELGAGTARDHRAAAAFFLSRGAFGAAATEVKALEVMEAKEDAAFVREVVETVRAGARARADAALKEAEVLRLQKRAPEARAAYERAVQACDGYARTLWKYGAFLLESGREDAAAAEALEAAAAAGPEEPEAWYFVGEARRRAGRLEEAVAALERFLAEAPPDAPRREEARAALAEIRQAAAAAAARQVREEAARAYRKDGFAEAAELWRKVLEYAPGDAEATYFLGKSLLGGGNTVDGYVHLRKFLAAEKRGGSRVDDAKRIVRDLEQRLSESPAAARKHLEGANLVQQRKWREAIAVFDQALGLAPLRAETHLARAGAYQSAYVQEGRPEDLVQAARDLEVALAMNERSGQAWSLLALVRYTREEWPRAAEAAARAMPLDPQNVTVCEVMARASNKIGKFAEAESAASEGIRREPRAALFIARAEARCGLGRLGDARQDLDLAAQKFDLSTGDNVYRAEVLGRVIKAEKAAE